MDRTNEIVTEVMTKIEQIYPEFLIEIGMPDTQLARANYYLAMVHAFNAEPLPDDLVMEIVMDMLVTRANYAAAKYRKDIRSRVGM